MIHVERARSARHWQEIDDLQLGILPNDKPYSTAEGAWWVAYDGDLPVAFAGIAQSQRWHDTMYLCRAGVRKSHQGQGLQKRLIRVRQAYAKAQGKRWLITDTTDNPASANSLISSGFRLFTPSWPWSFKAALYWRKKLA